MSVRKRILPSGGTAWQVDYRDSAGVRRARQFPTKREADAFNLKARSELAAGTHTPDSASITVREASDLWIARCERDKLEAGTLLDYRQHLKLHILPFLGSTKLSRLTVPMVNTFRDQLKSRTPATSPLYFSCCRASVNMIFFAHLRVSRRTKSSGL